MARITKAISVKTVDVPDLITGTDRIAQIVNTKTDMLSGKK